MTIIRSSDRLSYLSQTITAIEVVLPRVKLKVHSFATMTCIEPKGFDISNDKTVGAVVQRRRSTVVGIHAGDITNYGWAGARCSCCDLEHAYFAGDWCLHTVVRCTGWGSASEIRAF